MPPVCEAPATATTRSWTKRRATEGAVVRRRLASNARRVTLVGRRLKVVGVRASSGGTRHWPRHTALSNVGRVSSTSAARRSARTSLDFYVEGATVQKRSTASASVDCLCLPGPSDVHLKEGL